MRSKTFWARILLLFIVGAGLPLRFFSPAVFAAQDSDTNEAQAQRLIAYLKKHQNAIRSEGGNQYFRSVLWQLLAIDFKTLSGPTKRSLMELLLQWSGANLSEEERAQLVAELKKKVDGDLDAYWDKMRLAVLKEVDARDLSRELRDALKDAFGKLRMSQAGMKRLDILDRDEERFVNEMLFAGIMPSQSSDLAKLGNDLITNLAANVISGGFSTDQLAVMAKSIAKALGLQNSTTGKLIEEAVQSKIVQAAVGPARMPEIFNRVSELRQKLSDVPADATFNPPIAGGKTPAPVAPSPLSVPTESAAGKTHTSSKVPKIQLPKGRAANKEKAATSEDFTLPVAEAQPMEKAPPTPPQVTARNIPEPEPLKAPVPVETAAQGQLLQYLGGDYSNFAVDESGGAEASASSGAAHLRKAAPTVDLKKREEESIRSGSKVDGCDVKGQPSQDLCKRCPDKLPCKCYSNMERLYFGTGSDGKDIEENLRTRSRAVADKLEKEVQDRVDFFLKDTTKKLESKSLSKEEREKLLKKKETLEASQAPGKIYDRGFYNAKAMLNALMRSKTPACILSNESSFSDKKPDPTIDLNSTMIQGNEKYCHQFDLKPDEDYSQLSKQDELMLSLFKVTMRELGRARAARDEYARRQLGGKQNEAKQTIESPEDSTVLGGNGKSASDVPALTSQKRPELIRSFENESKRSEIEKGIPFRTENRIERGLRECFGMQEWGGMLLKNLDYLQKIAANCGDAVAYEMEVKKKFRTNIESFCLVYKRREGWIAKAPTGNSEIGTAEEKKIFRDKSFRNRAKTMLGSKAKAANDMPTFCNAINEEYRELFDIIKTAIFNSPAICDKEKLKSEYKAQFTEEHYE